MKDVTNEKKNHEYCLDTIEAGKKTEETVMALAERLHRIRQLNLYTPSWDSFEEFCMEIKNLSYKSIMKLIDIHETFVLKYKLAPEKIAEAGGWTVIAELLPVIKTKEDAIHWLERAKTAPREHLRQDVREARRGIPQGTCSHKNYVVLHKCKDCGFTHAV